LKGISGGCPQFPQHLFSIDEPARLDIFLRGDQGPVEGGTISRLEPVAGIERQEVHFSSLGKLCRLVHQEPTIMNTGLESHVERILRIPDVICRRLGFTFVLTSTSA
jgi:hypothetical protein